MNYIERQPLHPLLKKCVACFWSITVPPTHLHARKMAVADLPDGHTEYLFNGSVPFFREVVNSPETSSTNFTSLLYAQKRSMSVVTISNTHLFCIRFKPYGLYHLSGKSLFEITGHALEPRFIFGKWATELEERILSVTDFNKRVIVAETVLAEMLKHSRTIDPIVPFILNRIKETQGMMGVHEMTAAINKNRRTLEMKFRDHVGLTIKDLCRIYRFNHFWNLRKQCPNTEILKLALDCGFYDQSHFIRDFKFFTGYTPLSFLHSDFDVVMNSAPERLISQSS